MLGSYYQRAWVVNPSMTLAGCPAFRDAVAAHGRLLGRNILHRDIAVHNILFCPVGTTSGPRSILIDLDMAVWGDRSLDEISKDPRSDDNLYMSVSALRNKLNEDLQLAQNYLDDLESFLYALCHIVFAFKRPGVQHPILPKLIEKWKTDPDPATRKVAFFFHKVVWPPEFAVEFWGAPCKKLIVEYHDFLRDIVCEKGNNGNDEVTDEEKLKRIGARTDKIYQHYVKIDNFFLTALAGISEEMVDEISPPAELAPATDPPTLPGSAGTESPEIVDEEPLPAESMPATEPSILLDGAGSQPPAAVPNKRTGLRKRKRD
ncbi:hypothetical protein D9611_006020 [Ephemerocybe angulata]|uniref:Fungal-type protein kinase domain-containing protein n=1 Tax=Ephemerocybe angulata TaxID=980116 RepID=A0A8H5FLW2_9AGAR|nr:hypothetical protein D9611_006020 [Tulosesus angulatus]